MVTLWGSGLSRDTHCLFGSEKAKAFPVPDATSTLLGCISPAGQALGPVSVQVGVGTNDDWIPSNLTFLYYPAVTVTRVQPSSAQIERGELVVTVTGSWFMEKESLSCVFGLRSVTQASYISSSCVLCPPCARVPGPVGLCLGPHRVGVPVPVSGV